MSRAVTLLLVDDDTVDSMAFQRAFREFKIANPVVEAHDGIEALERLRGENGFEKLVPSPGCQPFSPASKRPGRATF
jgi:CheY-like chemotaxis protein